MAWVATTGRPDQWVHHDPSRPTKDEDFEELREFSIPVHHRSAVGKATCPICSPEKGKYYDGVLAWFPQSGALRAIGSDCAASHFGSEKAASVRQARRYKERVVAAEDYLLDTLPTLDTLRTETTSLIAVARAIDDLRVTFWRRTSQPSCMKIAKLGQSGILTLERVRQVAGVNEFGQQIVRHESERIAEFKAKGLSFLAQRYSVHAHAVNTLTAIDAVRSKASGDVVDFVAGLDGKLGYLQEAVKLLEGATLAHAGLLKMVEDARSFVSPENLRTLTEWSSHKDSNSPFVLTYRDDRKDVVQVYTTGKPATSIPIPRVLRA